MIGSQHFKSGFVLSGSLVRVLSTTRKVPALTVNGRYQVFVRNGKEFIIDWHGGYVPVEDAKKADIVLEKVQ